MEGPWPPTVRKKALPSTNSLYLLWHYQLRQYYMHAGRVIVSGMQTFVSAHKAKHTRASQEYKLIKINAWNFCAHAWPLYYKFASDILGQIRYHEGKVRAAVLISTWGHDYYLYHGSHTCMLAIPIKTLPLHNFCHSKVVWPQPSPLMITYVYTTCV